ncbi:uncharacterized protein LOC126370808 [Pectinophora gossypiella]|uniref:uncharacterized protein LOC126370808 n=1 Tax=Pectinophora gossypiella TaxID=13191 RepID=UPI00214E74E7|nr:uncharacterized protein LOC126370808 [Pectinophora gossypiella]
MRLLVSDGGLAPFGEDTLRALQEKHPSPSRPLSIPDGPDGGDNALTVSVEDVADAIGSFYNSSASGLDGLRPQHLKELISPSAGDNGFRLLESITCLCNFMLRGAVNPEVCPYIYGASLFALAKKDGGIRPIAVGNTFRRLVAKLGCRAVKDRMAALLRPHQLGFGTALGCEAAIHATRAFAMNVGNSGKVIVKLDVCNAFNSVERDTVLAQVKDLIPSVYPFVYQCYAKASKLFFDDSSIESQVGAQQGDPLGPLIFSLAIHKAVESLKSPLNIWYLDDGTIGGPQDVVARDIHRLFPALGEMGLKVNTAKCEIFPCGPEAMAGLATFKDLIPGLRVVTKDNFMLLGAPIFPDAVSAALREKKELLLRGHAELKRLSAHVALVLLRGSLSLPKLTYLIRTSPTWLFPQEVADIDEVLRCSLEDIINISLGEREWRQAGLPVRHGGLGVRRVQDIGVSAFLASANGSLELVTNIIFFEGDSFRIPFADEAQSAWNALCPNTTSPEKPQYQRNWDDLWAKSAVADLMELSSGADLARLRAALCPESGAWLHALPSPHVGTLLDDNTLRIGVALRLGCRMCEPHTCRCDKAGKTKEEQNVTTTVGVQIHKK